MQRSPHSSRDYRRFNFFFFNDTATTEIYTLSLHDALPIYCGMRRDNKSLSRYRARLDDLSELLVHHRPADRKSTRLNSSHTVISYAVFCLKKKKKSSISNFACHITCNDPA